MAQNQQPATQYNLPQTRPKQKQYEITPLPPDAPSKVYIPPPVSFDPSKSNRYQQQQIEKQVKQRQKMKNEKVKNSQQLNNNNSLLF